MSFFYDVMNDLGDDFNAENLRMIYLQSKGLCLSGKIKILSFDECEISIKYKKSFLKIEGKHLIIKTVAKGELLVLGEIKNMCFCEQKSWMKFM